VISDDAQAKSILQDLLLMRTVVHEPFAADLFMTIARAQLVDVALAERLGAQHLVNLAGCPAR
jgi:hypothetical protein